MIIGNVSVLAETFDEEFATFTSSPDGSSGTWMTTYPYSGEDAHTLTPNSEAEYYSSDVSGSNSPFSLAAGSLNISASVAAAGSNPYGLPYTSGLITTYKSFAQTYGYFEISAKLPSGQGLWPAFWMLPADDLYTSELDVFEVIGSRPDVINSSTHGSTGGVWGGLSQGFLVPDTSTGFHTYGVDWEPMLTTFYMDGAVLGIASTPASMNTPMYMLLNLAVGGAGSWPGVPDAATGFPATLQIDYVHAYATAATTYVGGSAVLPSYLSATTVPTSSTVILGTGPDVLALQIAEDAYLGNAQFTISVDGMQIGVAQTTAALHSLGATQAFDVRGSFAAGIHTVSINFLNDLSAADPLTGNRNLFVTQASINNVNIAGSALALGTTGAKSFSFQQAAQATDTLVLGVSEDAWQGDARYTVSVDGQQAGGVYTATASHAAGQVSLQTINGSWGKGAHTVGISFINDAYGGSDTTDRNLYINSANFDGSPIAMTPIAQPSTGTAIIAIPAVSHPGILTIYMAEDAFQGNAQFTLAINGTQIGGSQAVTAINGKATQAFSFADTLTATQDIAVSFTNDLYGSTSGSPGDRNLYVAGAEFNGVALNPAIWTAKMFSNGTSHFSLPGVPASSVPSSSVPATQATDTLVLSVSEDAWQGDAQYTVSVDGQQAGVYTATASHAAGQVSLQTINGSWGKGAHTVGISFINDAYGGSGTTDRNLYINSANFDGSPVAMTPITQLSNGTAVIAIPAVSNSTVSNPGVLTIHMAEDAFQGNAEFTLAINGTQIGGSQAVTAINGKATQAFSFADTLTATQDIAISFTNDLYNSTSNTPGDRNLYVAGAEFNGVALNPAIWTANMFSNGTSHFSLTVP
jgi:beta-glucanase (GH16 family)